MSLGPESLQIHENSGHLRGVLQFERNERKMQAFFGLVIAFGVASVVAMRASSDVAPYAFGLAFLLLCASLPLAFNVMNLPRAFDLDASLVVLGNDEILLSRITSIEVHEQPRRWMLTIRERSGDETSWPLAALYHSREDVEWLANAIRERRPAQLD
ncbi:MAG: hypothetical protein KC912_12290 [Proteobacteria bacterium]|nr:hypothetical protein [Pseudomonadota bacterium]